MIGRSFGNSKRGVRGKRNFDEIDNAGFKDYLYKRNFDEIDNAGFRDNLKKRNFDEIDNAGFRDNLRKRNFDEIDNAGFQDYLYKRNFDEIDNAGFSDYLSKRTSPEMENSGYRNSQYRKTPNDTYYMLLREYHRLCKSDRCRKKFEYHPYRVVLQKRNFDEIDNAGFRDYLYKRSSSASATENPTFAILA